MIRWIFAIAVALATLAAFLVPPAQNFREPELARIIFFHLPCAICTPIFFFFGSYLSLQYLRNRTQELDIRAAAANKLGYVLAILTMVTGILFSRTQWGAWWQWDPRQTSFLLLLLLYAAYFALRASLTDANKRAANSAAYSCVGALAAFFLIFVFPRLPYVQQISFHPSNTIVTGGFDPTYSTVLSTLFILILVLCAWVYKLAVRAGLLELKLQNYGELEIRGGDTASIGVVRPIPLSQEGGAQAGRG